MTLSRTVFLSAIVLLACQPLTPFELRGGGADAGAPDGGGTPNPRTDGGSDGGRDAGADAGRDAGSDAGQPPGQRDGGGTFTYTLYATENTPCFTAVTGVDAHDLYLASDLGIHHKTPEAIGLVSSLQALSLSAAGADVFAAVGDAGVATCTNCPILNLFRSTRPSGWVVNTCTDGREVFTVGTTINPPDDNTAVYRREGPSWVRYFAGVNVRAGVTCAIGPRGTVVGGTDSVTALWFEIDGGIRWNEDNTTIRGSSDEADRQYTAMAAWGDTFIFGSQNGALVRRTASGSYELYASGTGMPVYAVAPLSPSELLVANTVGSMTHLLINATAQVPIIEPVGLDVRALWVANANEYYVAGCQGGHAALYKATR